MNSEYWQESCTACGHTRREHEDGEAQYCELNPCNCPQFTDSPMAGISVLMIKPFWRYAVVPAHLKHREAAMPFYTKKSALAFIEECKTDTAPVFDMKMLLFRKVWFRRIEEVRL